MQNPDRAAELLKIERFIANHGVRRGRARYAAAVFGALPSNEEQQKLATIKIAKPPSRDEYRKWLSSSHRAQRQR